MGEGWGWGDSGAGISSPAPTHSEKDSSLLRDGGGLHGLDPAGAELELRDLAEGVELRVGQHVGGRLVEAEGNEHHALRHVAVGAHVQRDLAAPRRHLHHVAGRSEEHTSELQSLMRISYAVFCLKKKNKK